jgi:hypothetical protein
MVTMLETGKRRRLRTAATDDVLEVTKDVFGARGLSTRLFFGDGILRGLLLPVSLAKPTSAPMLENGPGVSRPSGNRAKSYLCEFEMLFFTVVVVERVGSHHSGLGRFDEPFIAIRVVAGLANRIVRDDKKLKFL